MKKGISVVLIALTLFTTLLIGGCLRTNDDAQTPGDTANVQADERANVPEMPEKLMLSGGVPMLVVYDTQRANYQQMDVESYVAGVLAGEMRNDWPMEALKAQAILARTYAMKFVAEKESKYGGADISTDIKEAQAYDEEKINERILKAVDETRGQVLSSGGELPYAWFHAHAGGVTDLAKAGLDFEQDEPSYTQSVQSPDSDRAPTTVKQWTARFTSEEVGKAAAEAGVRTGAVKTMQIGQKSAAGRAITFEINGKTVSAPALRIALNSAKLKSTLIDSVTVKGDAVVFEGRGYGHGVGMSQWGAYGMAEEGKSAEEIVKHYFKNIQIASMW